MVPQIFYNLAFSVLALAYLPRFVAKSRQAADRSELVRQRLGRFSEDWKRRFQNKKIIWLHAVSVGEVMAVQKWIHEFLRRVPEVEIVFTTVTPTGQKIAKQMEGKRIHVCYFPFDWSGSVGRFFNAFHPIAVLLVETEIWPNLLLEANRRKIPIGVINARLSPKSSARYCRFRFLFRSLFERLDFVLAQSEMDAERFEKAGVPRKKIHILGNLKFDNVKPAGDPKFAMALKSEWGLHPEDPILLAGSTHPGEEEILLSAFTELRTKFPSLKLVLAPRHVERSEKILRRVQARGFAAALVTCRKSSCAVDVLILDRLGILKNVYAIADGVFMGGSLIAKGGQNPIEPACFERPIIHGPHTFNFEKIYRELDLGGGALLVRDETQLVFAVSSLLHKPNESKSLGEHALATVTRLQGATQRHIQWLVKHLALNTEERIPDVFRERLFPSAGRRT